MKVAFGLFGMGAIVMTALASFGCSDTVPPPAQGAVSYHFTKAAGQSCFVNPHFSNAPDLGKGQNVTASNVGEVAVDGQNGAQIKCHVKAQGSAYDVGAEFDLGNVSLSLATTIADGQSDAEGSVSLQDHHTQTPYIQPAKMADPPTAPCKFSVKAQKGQSLGVASGWIWGHFICDKILDERSPEGVCTAEGTFLFENCDE